MSYLDQVRARAAAATTGPWKGGQIMLGDSGDYSTLGLPTHPRMPDMFLLSDADFIAQAREDIPELLRRLEIAQDALAAIDFLKEGFEEDYIPRASKLAWDALAETRAEVKRGCT